MTDNPTALAPPLTKIVSPWYLKYVERYMIYQIRTFFILACSSRAMYAVVPGIPMVLTYWGHGMALLGLGAG